jgi:hypothetical protein
MIMHSPFKWPESVGNDTFSIRFDNGFEWGSVSGIRKVWDQALA